jgi:hypothetical protein
MAQVVSAVLYSRGVIQSLTTIMAQALSSYYLLRMNDLREAQAENRNDLDFTPIPKGERPHCWYRDH